MQINNIHLRKMVVWCWGWSSDILESGTRIHFSCSLWYIMVSELLSSESTWRSCDVVFVAVETGSNHSAVSSQSCHQSRIHFQFLNILRSDKHFSLYEGLFTVTQAKSIGDHDSQESYDENVYKIHDPRQSCGCKWPQPRHNIS